MENFMKYTKMVKNLQTRCYRVVKKNSRFGGWRNNLVRYKSRWNWGRFKLGCIKNSFKQS